MGFGEDAAWARVDVCCGQATAAACAGAVVVTVTVAPLPASSGAGAVPADTSSPACPSDAGLGSGGEEVAAVGAWGRAAVLITAGRV